MLRIDTPRRAVAVAVGAVLLLLSPALLRGSLRYEDLTFEQDFFHHDALTAAAAARYRRLEPPLWNPLVALGVPFPSSVETPYYPPVVLLAAPVPFETGWAWVFTAHLLLGATGVVLLLVEAGAMPAAAAFAGVAYAASPRFLPHLRGLPAEAFMSMFLPWILLGVRRAEADWRRGSPVLAAAWGIAYLSSPPSHIHVPVVAAVVYAVARIPWAGWAAVRAAGAAAAAAVCAFGVASVQYVPLVAAGGEAARAGAGYAYTAAWSAAPQTIALLFAPGAIHDALRSRGMLFIGAAPLLLAPLAFRRAGEAVPIAAAGLFALLAGFGDATPVYRVFVYPFFPMIRAPGRLLDATALSAALLAGWGMHEWLRAGRRPRLRLAAAGLAVAAALSSAALTPWGRSRPLFADAGRWAAAAASVAAGWPAAGLAVDVSTCALPAHAAPSSSPRAPRAAIEAALAAIPPGARVLPLDGMASVVMPADLIRRGRRSLLSVVSLSPRDFVDGMGRRLGGPGVSEDPDGFFACGVSPFGRIDGEALGRWGVEWFVRDGPGGPEATPNPRGLPRAYLVVRGAPAVGAARFVRDEPEEVVVETTSETDGLLVLADQFHPDWAATVDGRPVVTARVEDAVRGVAVPAGRHRVAFRYRATAHRLGAAVTIVTAAVLAALLLRRDPAPPPSGSARGPRASGRRPGRDAPSFPGRRAMRRGFRRPEVRGGRREREFPRRRPSRRFGPPRRGDGRRRSGRP